MKSDFTHKILTYEVEYDKHYNNTKTDEDISQPRGLRGVLTQAHRSSTSHKMLFRMDVLSTRNT